MSPLTAGRLLVAVLGGLFVFSRTAAGEGEEPQPTDPRVIEANGLLSDERARERTLALYRAALADDPDNDIARRWLARVLSWDGSYDESLAEYDVFLRRDPPPTWARRERADVLAWAGRYAGAEAAYKEFLADDPNDFDALAGLSRVYNWGGRGRDAEVAYRQALAVRDDEELRAELQALLEKRVRSAVLETRYFGDSDDFEEVQAEGLGRYEFIAGTQLLLRARFTYVKGFQHGPGGIPAPKRSDDSAFDGLIGLQHRFSKALRATLELGGRAWGSAPARFMLNGEVDYTVDERTAVGLQLDHGDFLDVSSSLDAAQRGINYTRLRFWAWRSVSEHVSMHAAYGASFISDGNLQNTGTLSASCKPWSERELRFTLGGFVTGMTETSDFYYDPALDASLQLEAAGRHRFNDTFGLSYQGSVGFGYSEQDRVSGFGPAFGARAGPTVSVYGWDFDLMGYGSRSQRTSSYTTWGALFRVVRGF